MAPYWSMWSFYTKLDLIDEKTHIYVFVESLNVLVQQ